MAIQTISTAYNPVSGVFGTGQVQMFFTSSAWTVPTGISRVRARVWGAGGGGASGGAGGGFSLKAIYELTGVTSVAITIGAGGIPAATTGGTSSFGPYCSATGGTTSVGGSGSGGDINYSGGSSANGGAASIFGSGNGSIGSSIGLSGGAGQGTASVNVIGYPGFMGAGGGIPTLTPFPPMSGLQQFSIDYIGTGGGAGPGQNGINGSGSGNIVGYTYGGIPGGGGGTATTQGAGGQGLVIVEW